MVLPVTRVSTGPAHQNRSSQSALGGRCRGWQPDTVWGNSPKGPHPGRGTLQSRICHPARRSIDHGCSLEVWVAGGGTRTPARCCVASDPGKLLHAKNMSYLLSPSLLAASVHSNGSRSFSLPLRTPSSRYQALTSRPATALRKQTSDYEEGC
jgi:hypothetical protein